MDMCRGHTRICSLLLEKGGDVNAKDGEHHTPLHAARYLPSQQQQAAVPSISPPQPGRPCPVCVLPDPAQAGGQAGRGHHLQGQPGSQSGSHWHHEALPRTLPCTWPPTPAGWRWWPCSWAGRGARPAYPCTSSNVSQLYTHVLLREYIPKKKPLTFGHCPKVALTPTPSPLSFKHTLEKT